MRAYFDVYIGVCVCVCVCILAHCTRQNGRQSSTAAECCRVYAIAVCCSMLHSIAVYSSVL